jgi:hypothetical protein
MLYFGKYDLLSAPSFTEELMELHCFQIRSFFAGLDLEASGEHTPLGYKTIHYSMIITAFDEISGREKCWKK